MIIQNAKNKIYAGIGSRETPKNICNLMTKIATKLNRLNYTLNSGGADGADTAFENGAGYNKNIFYPVNVPDWAYKKVQQYCNPYSFFNKSPKQKALIARNMQQVLGKDGNEWVNFIICWTKNAQLVGGTRYALMCALDPIHSIPIYNLAREDHYNRLLNFTKK